MNFGHQSTEVGFFNNIETPTAVFGGIAIGIKSVVNEGAITLTIIALDLCKRDDLIDNAGQLKRCF